MDGRTVLFVKGGCACQPLTPSHMVRGAVKGVNSGPFRSAGVTLGPIKRGGSNLLLTVLL